jgi:hypothetical protein
VPTAIPAIALDAPRRAIDVFFGPPARPKDPPFEWTQLHEAAAFILDREVEMEPDAFLKWLQKRPGALVIYLMIAEGAGIEDEIKRGVAQDLSRLPEVGMPATLAELMDKDGRIPSSPGVRLPLPASAPALPSTSAG